MIILPQYLQRSAIFCSIIDSSCENNRNSMDQKFQLAYACALWALRQNLVGVKRYQWQEWLDIWISYVYIFQNWILKSKALYIPIYFLILIQSLNNQMKYLLCVKKYIHWAIKTHSWSVVSRILFLLCGFLYYKTELSPLPQSQSICLLPKQIPFSVCLVQRTL